MNIKRLLISAGIGLVVLGLLLLVAAGIALRLDLASSMLRYLAFGAAALAALVAGYIHVRSRRAQGLLFGALAAAVMYPIVLLISMAVSRGAPGAVAFILLPVMLLTGGAGGILAANRTVQSRSGGKKKRKRK
ncbi:MAG: TIGR04086 family membrane protein [Oscillospiraceae bacterium]|nr:TIGR04086 family membrane protein [Oscillospiraceae bacterium]